MTKLSKALIVYNLILLLIVAMMTAVILFHVIDNSKSISTIESTLSGIEFIEVK